MFFIAGGQIILHDLKMFKQNLRALLLGSITIAILIFICSVVANTRQSDISNTLDFYLADWYISAGHPNKKLKVNPNNLVVNDLNNKEYANGNNSGTLYYHNTNINNSSKISKQSKNKQKLTLSATTVRNSKVFYESKTRFWKSIRTSIYFGIRIYTASVILTIIIFCLRARHIIKTNLIRGGKIVKKSVLNSLVRRKNGLIYGIFGKKYKIADVLYPKNTEGLHTIITGTTGQGKTVVISDLIKQAREKGDRAIIYDKMGTFVEKFYNPEIDIILNPLDDRSPYWSIFNEARDNIDFETMAAALIPENSKIDDPFFTNAARILFSNVASISRRRKVNTAILKEDLKEFIDKKMPNFEAISYIISSKLPDLEKKFFSIQRSQNEIENYTEYKQKIDIMFRFAPDSTLLIKNFLELDSFSDANFEQLTTNFNLILEYLEMLLNKEIFKTCLNDKLLEELTNIDNFIRKIIQKINLFNKEDFDNNCQNKIQVNISNSELIEKLLTIDLKPAAELVKGTPAQSIIDQENPKTALSVMSVLSTNLKSLTHLRKKNDNDNKIFSIRDWINDDSKKGFLFLSSREDQHETLKPLISTWIDIAINTLLSLKQSKKRRIWTFLDELPSLNFLPSLNSGLAESRQYGGRFVIGLQSPSQMKAIYGVDKTVAISGLCNTRLFFKTPDRETAEWCSENLGKAELEKTKESITFGASDYRDGKNLSKITSQEYLVLPTEIMNLDILNAYIKLSGNFPVAKIKIVPENYGNTKNEKFIKRVDNFSSNLSKNNNETNNKDRDTHDSNLLKTTQDSNINNDDNNKDYEDKYTNNNEVVEEESIIKKTSDSDEEGGNTNADYDYDNIL